MSNILQMMLMMLLPTALPFTYGRMVGNKTRSHPFVSLFMVFLLGFITITTSELNGNPALNGMGIEHVQGSTEGKEVRFGTVFSSLYATVTTVAETGAVNTMHDTLTPIGGLVPLVNMMLNTVYGGVGAGFVNIIMYAIIAVFISGLMVGRTPEF